MLFSAALAFCYCRRHSILESGCYYWPTCSTFPPVRSHMRGAAHKRAPFSKSVRQKRDARSTRGVTAPPHLSTAFSLGASFITHAYIYIYLSIRLLCRRFAIHARNFEISLYVQRRRLLCKQAQLFIGACSPIRSHFISYIFSHCTMAERAYKIVCRAHCLSNPTVPPETVVKSIAFRYISVTFMRRWRVKSPHFHRLILLNLTSLTRGYLVKWDNLPDRTIGAISDDDSHVKEKKKLIRHWKELRNRDRSCFSKVLQRNWVTIGALYKCTLFYCWGNKTEPRTFRLISFFMGGNVTQWKASISFSPDWWTVNFSLVKRDWLPIFRVLGQLSRPLCEVCSNFSLMPVVSYRYMERH